ncbi:MAG: thiopeptide-type bacteriocin biosynthesis protein [Flavobacteriaceae bacterium]|nr:thiopeptide-type bacteriocin biosynthesis protein [Flavobacteriaceae bacterium]
MKKDVKRIFFLGDSWFYFKIYTGYEGADSLLLYNLFPLIEKWKVDGYIDKWFFIRFIDTKFHIRIRIHLTNINHYNHIINDLNTVISGLYSQHLLSNFQVDIYKRELERYGIENIETIENIFNCDSEVIIKLIRNIISKETENLRWLSGISLTDELLNLFNMSVKEKFNLMNQYVEFFKMEMNYNSNMKKQLSLDYRANKMKIESILVKNNEYSKTLFIIKERNRNINPLISKLIIKKNSTRMNELIFSLSHMSLNRLFKIRARENEFVIYHSLRYYYESSIARQRIRKKE